MRIERLDLIAYGHLTGVSLNLSAGPNRFHLIYGPNESGKSTSLRAITSWLFGVPRNTNDTFLHPNAKLRIGGKLVDQDGNELDCIRRRGIKATLRDASDKELVDDALMQAMLGGIDQQTFETRFGISHDELLRGGEQILQGHGELGEILFSAGAGIGRLREIHEQLIGDAGDLFKPRAHKTTINERLKKIQQLRRDLAEAQVPPAEFADLRQRLEKKTLEIARLQEAAQENAKRRATLQSTAQALPLVPKWRMATKELAEVADAPILPSDFPERRRQTEEDRLVAIRVQEQLEQRESDLTARLAELGDDESIRLHAEEVEAVYLDLPIREKAEVDCLQLHDSYRRTERRMKQRLRDVSQSQLVAEEPQAVAPNDPNPTQATHRDSLGDQIESLRLSETNRSKVQRLAGKFEKLVSQRDDAKAEIEQLTNRLAIVDQELSTKNLGANPETLSKALQDVGSPEHLTDAMQEHASRCKTLKERCETLHSRLGINTTGQSSGSFADAVLHAIPERALVARLSEAIEDSDGAVQLATTRLADVRRDYQSAVRSLETLQRETNLPSVKQLNRLRSERDNLLAQLQSRPVTALPQGLPSQLAKLESAISKADAMSDLILQHHEDVHRQQTAVEELDALHRDCDSREEELKQTKEDRLRLQTEWEALWSAVGVQAKSPDAMNDWLAHHAQLVELVEQWRECVQKHEASRQRVILAATRLQSACQVCRSSEDQDSNALAVCVSEATVGTQKASADELGQDQRIASQLVQVHEFATAERQRLVQLQRQQEQWTQQRSQWKAERLEAESTLKQREEALDQWQQQWEEATAALRTDSMLDPEDALPILDAIKDLTAWKKERDILQTRMDSIGSETNVYIQRVARLLLNLDLDANPTDESGESNLDSVDHLRDSRSQKLSQIAGQVTRLYERLQRERTATGTRSQLDEQLSRCQSELADTNRQLERLDIARQQLCKEAGWDQPDELQQIELQSQRRQASTAQLSDLEAQLTHWAGGRELDEFLEELRDLQPGLIDEEIASLANEKQTIDDELAAAQQEFGGLQHQFQAIDGSGRASQLSQELQFLLGSLQRESETYVRLQLACSIMKKAIDHYREANQEPVLREAERIFTRLTVGEYTALKVDYGDKGTPILLGVRGESDVPATRMSTGTADSLYLAMRLASLSHQMAHGKSFPLIVDDCLIQLDDRRAAAALEVFAEVSTKTQVILFTHHQHLIELASQALKPGQFHPHFLGDEKADNATEPASLRKTKASKKTVAKKPAANRKRVSKKAAKPTKEVTVENSKSSETNDATQQTSLW